MKSIFTILISLLSVALYAQASSSKSSSSAPTDCFGQWFSLFKERGANPVADGTHEVIITIRNGNYSDCFMGKIDVANGKLASPLQVQKVDGSYQEFDKRVSNFYQNEEGRLKEELRDVTNGMSASLTLTDGEIIRLFFYKSVADKPKANKKAPAPSVIIK